MDNYTELLKSLDKTRLSHDLEEWLLEELLYLECNLDEVDYLLECRKAVPTFTERPKNPNNSTVAYLLGITDEKPLSGIERTPTSPPDFDFDTNARDETIEYLSKKYGHNHVCLLGTYQTLQAKGSIKDVCRALRPPVYGPDGKLSSGMDFEAVNEITKKFSLNRNDYQSESDFFWACVEASKELKDFFNKNKDILDTVLNLLGNVKSSGIHAGGVVLSSEDIKSYIPLSFEQKEGVFVTQPEMAFVEQLGLIKYDFLGLKTLDDLSRCKKLIKDRYGLDFKLSKISTDEPDVLHSFAEGQTTSVFQFKTDLATGGVSSLNSIERGILTLAMVTSLYRRGPLNMGMDKVFLARANGDEEVTYLHPALEPILEETYGVIIYQEQVMEICKELGGFTGDESLTVMKAMGKKKKSVLDSFEKKFLGGAASRNIDPNTSKKIWDLMASFAEYGFNKSHAVAYATVSYLCAYFMKRFPLEWICAVLMGSDKEDFKTYYGSWKDKISKPNINESKEDFFIVSNQSVVMPLTAVNGVTDSVLPAILKHQPFSSFDNYLETMWSEHSRLTKEIASLRKQLKDDSLKKDVIEGIEESVEKLKVERGSYTKAMNRSVVTSMILAGCFDNFKAEGENDAFFRKNTCRRYFELKHSFKAPSKTDREADAELLDQIELMKRKDFLFEELKLLNFTSFDYFEYFNDLLYTTAEKHFKKQLLKPHEAIQKNDKEEVVVAGAISGIRFFTTKTGKNKGSEMCRITLSHNDTSIDITVFPSTLAQDDKGKRVLRQLKELHPFIVKGKINEWNGTKGIIYDAGITLV